MLGFFRVCGDDMDSSHVRLLLAYSIAVACVVLGAILGAMMSRVVVVKVRRKFLPCHGIECHVNVVTFLAQQLQDWYNVVLLLDWYNVVFILDW